MGNKLTIKTFFMPQKEYDQLPETNRVIMHKYVANMQASQKIKSEATIKNNGLVIRFILRVVKTDLDKLTIEDIDNIQVAIKNWQREDGKPTADASKKVYAICVKKFLNWYAKRYEQPKYRNLSNQIDVDPATKHVQPNELLTIAEIEQMITAADKVRDKAIIAVLAESGCRAGELVSCRVRDFEPTQDGGKLTFPKGKTGARQIPLVFSAPYINYYLKQHPDNDNLDAPLWLADGQGVRRGLTYHSVHHIVHEVTKAADIKKRVHPHLFRHTAATQLSKIWGESMMRTYLGWKPGSSMPSLYISLNGKDVEDAVLCDRFGIVEKKQQSNKGLVVGKCPHCWKVVPATATFCHNCGAPLTKEAQQVNNTAMQEFMAEILSDPTLTAKLAILMQKSNNGSGN